MKRALKGIAIIIIFLFIGVAITPSINTNRVKASKDNDIAEVTSQVYGIKVFGNTTVKLTQQQYQNLEQYLVGFRGRLNQTTTKEEATPIFKEAVVELNKYGLLPKGMSIEQAQKLVLGEYQNKILPIIRTNLFCLIAGMTTNTIVASPTLLLIEWMAEYFYSEYHVDFRSIFILLCYLFPFAFAGIIFMGSVSANEHGETWYRPCNGWALSIGSLGVKYVSKTIYGNIFWAIDPEFGGPFIGAVGFTGFRIPIINSTTGEVSSFYIGTALLTKFSSNHWPY